MRRKPLCPRSAMPRAALSTWALLAKVLVRPYILDCVLPAGQLPPLRRTAWGAKLRLR